LPLEEEDLDLVRIWSRRYGRSRVLGQSGRCGDEEESQETRPGMSQRSHIMNATLQDGAVYPRIHSVSIRPHAVSGKGEPEPIHASG